MKNKIITIYTSIQLAILALISIPNIVINKPQDYQKPITYANYNEHALKSVVVSSDTDRGEGYSSKIKFTMDFSGDQYNVTVGQIEYYINDVKVASQNDDGSYWDSGVNDYTYTYTTTTELPANSTAYVKWYSVGNGKWHTTDTKEFEPAPNFNISNLTTLTPGLWLDANNLPLINIPDWIGDIIPPESFPLIELPDWIAPENQSNFKWWILILIILIILVILVITTILIINYKRTKKIQNKYHIQKGDK